MWQQYTFESLMGNRPYFVYTPADYWVGKVVPLVVMLHGCGQSAEDFAIGTQMNRLADVQQFIVVYPQQVRGANLNGCWNWFDPVHQVRGSGEPAIIAGIVETIGEATDQWTIDPRRIYVAGASAGAAMAVILGATYPDIFAAIGVHSGAEYQAATSKIKALKAMRQGGPDPVGQGQLAYDAMGTFARVVPTIVFQGTNDHIVKAVNGDQVVQQWMHTGALASQNGYRGNFFHPDSSITRQVPGGHSFMLYRWSDFKGNVIQEYWRVKDMGHAWSGGSPDASYTDPRGPSASQAMYTFFMNHTMGHASLWGKFQRTIANLFKADSHG
jgi:poly(hydroxyalkanoate) depolymerase family esterase